jgi:hypothetical protein
LPADEKHHLSALVVGFDLVVWLAWRKLAVRSQSEALEHRAKKWVPVFRKNDATTNS